MQKLFLGMYERLLIDDKVPPAENFFWQDS